MNEKKLNLGCGKDIKKGWVNLDSVKLPGIDIVHNIEKLPIPFKNGEFDEILCQDILEHTDYVPILQELHRILKTGGKLTIRVPHFTSRNNFIDPTHKKLFSINTFDFFVKNSSFSKSKERQYYFDFYFDKISSSKITFEKSSRFLFYNRFVELLVNSSSKMKFLYEATGLSRIFPAENIVIEIIK